MSTDKILAMFFDTDRWTYAIEKKIAGWRCRK